MQIDFTSTIYGDKRIVSFTLSGNPNIEEIKKAITKQLSDINDGKDLFIDAKQKLFDVVEALAATVGDADVALRNTEEDGYKLIQTNRGKDFLGSFALDPSKESRVLTIDSSILGDQRPLWIKYRFMNGCAGTNLINLPPQPKGKISKRSILVIAAMLMAGNFISGYPRPVVSPRGATDGVSYFEVVPYPDRAP